MQDIHSIGAGGRLFLGGGGGDRRLRPISHQALKCPRCDSLNTKFCYYNNYNLSQPRHFCKNCRRYWTKGGVLRNVPVGGGVRKAKRAKNKPSSDLAASPSTPNEHQEHERNSNANSNSSCSESSSLTAITNANKATTTTIEAVTSGSNILPNSKSPNPNFEAGVPLIEEQGSDRGIFLEMASFTNMITSSSDQLQLQFGLGNMMTHHQQPEHDLVLPIPNQQWQDTAEKLKPMAGSTFVDQIQTAAIELPRTTGNGGFGSLDWQANTDQGLFDIPNSVDHSYWNQSHWTDHDQDQPPIYFP